jgi:TRAP-type mannitol/chloroaromatic compound transport system substrate-binding protein
MIRKKWWMSRARPLAVAALLSFAATAAAQEYRWTMATSWPSALNFHVLAEEFADYVERASGGRMVIDVQPSGAIVGALEVLDAADSGIVEMAHSWSGYWLGRHPAAPFFASIPMSLEAGMYKAWFFDYGGLELWNRLYQDEMGLNVLVRPAGIYHPETFAWANREIRTIEDFRGLRFRTVGWWADILRDAGVAVVSLPAAELYPSLERGVIDAVEFSTPWADRLLSFYEVTDYFTGPGMHQPAIVTELIINRSAFEALPDDLQAIIEIAADAIAMRAWARDIVMSIEAIKYYEEQGQVRVTVDPETQHEFRQMTWAYLDGLATQNEFFAEVWDSVQEFYHLFIDYENFMVPVRPQ